MSNEIDEDNVKKMQNKMHRMSSKIGQKWINRLDAYGDIAHESPSFREKTFLGAVMSTIFRLVFLMLVIISCLNLACGESWDILGRTQDSCRIVSNGPGVEINVKGLTDSDARMDLPFLFYEIAHKVTFFETEGPTVQKVVVSDLTDEDGTYTSSTKELPVTLAVTKKMNVPLGTFDPAASGLWTPSSSTLSLKDILDEKASSQFEESLKLLYRQDKVLGEYPNTFFNNSGSLYVRFDQTELTTALKQCQLQVSLMNLAEYQALKDSQLLYDETAMRGISALSGDTEDVFWSPSSFDANSMEWAPPALPNLATLRAGIDEQGKAALAARVSGTSGAKYMDNKNVLTDWLVSVNYVNNFKHVIDQYTCSNDFHKGFSSQMFQNSAGLGAANLVDATATTITITVPSNSQLASAGLPKQLLLSGAAGQEVVTLTAVAATSVANQLSLTVTRATVAVDFTKYFIQASNISLTPPAQWMCSPEKYNSVDGCHCGCGAPDPDCLVNNVPTSATGKPQTQTVTVGCADGDRCSIDGECYSPPKSADFSYASGTPTNLYISQPCDRIFSPGEERVVGFSYQPSSSSLSSCKACPGDNYYNQNSVLHPTRGPLCNYDAQGWLSSGDMYSFFNSLSLPGQGPIQLPIRMFLGNYPQFPVLNTNIQRYAVLLSEGLRHEESAEVVATTDPSNGVQIFTLNGVPANLHFGYGALIGGLDSRTSTIAVASYVVNQMTFTFPSAGVYPLYVSTFKLDVVSASKPVVDHENDTNYQLLTINTHGQSMHTFGTIGSLAVAVSIDPTASGPPLRKLVVETTNMLELKPEEAQHSIPYTPTPPLNQFSELKTPFRIFVSEGNVLTDEIATVTSVSLVSPTGWVTSATCPLSGYGDGEICHCGCGILDPDCAMPSLAMAANRIDAGKLTVQNCPPNRKYCSAAGACTAIKPTDTSQTQNTKVREELTLHRPLSYSHSANALVSTSATIPANAPASAGSNDDTSKLTHATMRTKVRLDRGTTTAASGPAYKPKDRHLPTTPEPFKSASNLKAELALFMSPKRLPLVAPPGSSASAEVALCPDPKQGGHYSLPQSPQTPAAEKYTDRILKIAGCSKRVLGDSGCVNSTALLKKGEFRKQCTKDMPPTGEAEVTVVQPLNYRWKSGLGSSGTVMDKEIKVDVLTAFQFTYDTDAAAAEKEFAASLPVGSDIGSDPLSRSMFSGSLDYRGPGGGHATRVHPTGVSRAVNGGILEAPLPANPPYLTTTITLKANTDVSVSLLKEWRQQLDTFAAAWGATDEQMLAAAQRWEPLAIEFDMRPIMGDTDSQTVLLQPGFMYTLSATIAIAPVYSFDLMGTANISSWKRSVLSTSVSKTPLNHFDRAHAHVRYKVRVEPSSRVILSEKTFTFSAFVANFGSNLAIMGVGVIVVKFLQKHPLFKASSSSTLRMELFSSPFGSFGKAKAKPEDMITVDDFPDDGLPMQKQQQQQHDMEAGAGVGSAAAVVPVAN